MEEIALNNTVLKRSDGCRVWYPNSMMNVQPVLNVSRSDNRWEFFKVRHTLCKRTWDLAVCVCNEVVA